MERGSNKYIETISMKKMVWFIYHTYSKNPTCRSCCMSELPYVVVIDHIVNRRHLSRYLI